MAFIFEAAGGRATTGLRRILEIHPETLHQRTPLILGSPDDVADFEHFSSPREGNTASDPAARPASVESS